MDISQRDIDTLLEIRSTIERADACLTLVSSSVALTGLDEDDPDGRLSYGASVVIEMVRDSLRASAAKFDFLNRQCKAESEV